MCNAVELVLGLAVGLLVLVAAIGLAVAVFRYARDGEA